jgi:propanol-preferring alcohol dehydrogenase
VKTRAAVLTAPQGAVEIRSVEIPDPGPGEVLVRMEACGVCHSDVFVSGLAKLPRTPLTLGHEGIGRIVALGPETPGFANGDRVGITFLGSTCGECVYCRNHRRRFCPSQTNTGYTVDGAMAGYAVAKAREVIVVPEGIDAASIAPLCCAGWTAYGALTEAIASIGKDFHGSTVAIFGYGGLGQLALQYGLSLGLKVAVVDVSETKIERAKAAGAFLAVNSPGSGRSLQKQTGGVDAAIVFTGSTEAMEQAIKSVKRTGTVVVVGLTTRDLPVSVTELVLKGIRITGSYLGSRWDLAAVFKMATNGVVASTETFPLDQAPQVLDRLKKGEIAGRAVISFD